MNTNLTQIIIETIEQSKQVLGEGFDFARKETPLVIQEFLNWKFIEALVVMGFLWLLVAVMVKVTRWAWKKAEADKFDDPAIIMTIVTICALLVAIISSFFQTKTAIQIKVAPRVYLIEWAADAWKGR